MKSFVDTFLLPDPEPVYSRSGSSKKMDRIRIHALRFRLESNRVLLSHFSTFQYQYRTWFKTPGRVQGSEMRDLQYRYFF
jgi:hypothetical protein